MRFSILIALMLIVSRAQAQIDLRANAPYDVPAISLELSLHGQDVEKPWRDFLSKLVDYFDQDRDGTLNREEVARMMPLPLPDRGLLTLDFATLDANRNGAAAPQEMEEYSRLHGFAPVVVEYVPHAERDLQLAHIFHKAMATPSDTTLPQALRRYDLNEDDVWEENEFLAFAGDVLRQADAADLSQKVESTPRAVLRIELGSDLPESAAATTTQGDIVSTWLASRRFRVSHPREPWTLTVVAERSAPDVATTREFLLAQFQASAGSNGFLRLDEIGQSPSLSGFTELARYADRDADGQLTSEELNAYCDLVAQGAACQVWVQVTDHTGNPTALIDGDSNGRLSMAELSFASVALTSEIDCPSRRYFSLEFVGPSAKSWGGVALPKRSSRSTTPTVAVTSSPKWFRAMDANDDGLVTARESPLPAEHFRALDADADGLLSADEASSASGVK